MTALLATVLLFSLALALLTAFAPPGKRRLCRWMLAGTLLVVWLALGAAIFQALTRTATTVVATPGTARPPRLVEQASREGLTLLYSMGGPALIATVLGLLAIFASRRKEA